MASLSTDRLSGGSARVMRHGHRPMQAVRSTPRWPRRGGRPRRREPPSERPWRGGSRPDGIRAPRGRPKVVGVGRGRIVSAWNAGMPERHAATIIGPHGAAGRAVVRKTRAKHAEKRTRRPNLIPPGRPRAGRDRPAPTRAGGSGVGSSRRAKGFQSRSVKRPPFPARGASTRSPASIAEASSQPQALGERSVCSHSWSTCEQTPRVGPVGSPNSLTIAESRRDRVGLGVERREAVEHAPPQFASRVVGLLVAPASGSWPIARSKTARSRGRRPVAGSHFRSSVAGPTFSSRRSCSAREPHRLVIAAVAAVATPAWAAILRAVAAQDDRKRQKGHRRSNLTGVAGQHGPGSDRFSARATSSCTAKGEKRPVPQSRTRRCS